MTKHTVARTLSLIFLMLGAVCLLPLGQKLIGFSLLAVGLVCLLFTTQTVRKHFSLIFFSLAVLGLTPINTDLSPAHVAIMGAQLLIAVAVPYIVTRYVYKEPIITYPFAMQRWTRQHVGYVLLAALAGYLLLPFWMQTTGGHMNWTVPLDPAGITMLFIGTNALGIWDELFFIITALALLRRHLPFWQANIIQAVLFTAFLYELGFRDWMPFMVFPFALLQGIVFKSTHNLPYIIVIHLVIDFVLFIALINAHHPQLFPIFLS